VFVAFGRKHQLGALGTVVVAIGEEVVTIDGNGRILVIGRSSITAVAV